MNTFDKSIDQIFDVVTVPETPKANISMTLSVSANTETQPNIENDLNDAYEKTRENLEDFITQGKEAMDEILVIAKTGQAPRAFEVYSTLLKNMVDANKELLNVQKQIREMDSKKNTQKPGTTIDKAIFVGTTAEFSRLLKNNRDK